MSISHYVTVAVRYRNLLFAFISFVQLLAPGPFIGCFMCFLNATTCRVMATLVDSRFTDVVYGTVYALVNISFAAAYGLGKLY